MTDAQFRFGGTLAGIKAKRIGIEKKGDAVAIFISLTWRADAPVWSSYYAALR